MSEYVTDRNGIDVVPVDKLPEVTAVITRTFEDLKENIVPYLLSGAGLFMVIFAAVFILLAVVFLPVMPGLLMENETILAVGGIIGLVLYLLGFVVIGVGSPLMMASMYRGAWTQLDGEGTLGFGSAFNDLRADALNVFLTYLLIQLLVLVGMLFCYLPGIILAVILMPVQALVAGRGVKATEAIALVGSHAKDNIGWHLGVGFLGLLVMMVMAYIPIVGMFVAYPFMAVYHVATVRAIFGDGKQ